jgi:hypothetical protein
MRKIVTEDYIETPQEQYESKYGDEIFVERDPKIIEIMRYLENMGATKIEDTYGVVPKITFVFPVGHEYDSYQNIILVLEKEEEIQLNAELKHEIPFYFNIRRKQIVEDEGTIRKKRTFFQTYVIDSNDPKFADKILEETLIDEVISEHEAQIDLISVHKKSLTATITSTDSIELLFILLTTILVTYSK